MVIDVQTGPLPHDTPRKNETEFIENGCVVQMSQYFEGAKQGALEGQMSTACQILTLPSPPIHHPWVSGTTRNKV